MTYQELLNEARILRDRALVVRTSDPDLSNMLMAHVYDFEYAAFKRKDNNKKTIDTVE